MTKYIVNANGEREAVTFKEDPWAYVYAGAMFLILSGVLMPPLVYILAR